MTWEAEPNGKPPARPQRCRRPGLHDDEVLIGMALRQTTGFVESLLRLIGLNGAVPDIGTLRRRR